MAKRWYVVHAYSGFEKQVMRALKERVALESMEDKFGDILVPTEEVVEMRDGKKRKSERKFYPGYVLVQMELDDESWHLVKDTPRVLGFIGGTKEKPAPITEREAEAILRRVESGADKPKPKSLSRVKWLGLSKGRAPTSMAWSKKLITTRVVSRLLF